MGIDPESVRLTSLEDAELQPASYDFITFGAVLEHLYDPSAALKKTLGWLRPGGVIQAEVPSSNHLIAKLINFYFGLRGTNFVTNVSPMHSPFHIYEFTLDSFIRNGARTGYEVVEHKHMVCTIFHLPAFLHPPLRAWMDRTNTGMQLTVWLKAS
jgi:predicted SAM-dependent methyltransferase